MTQINMMQQQQQLINNYLDVELVEQKCQQMSEFIRSLDLKNRQILDMAKNQDTNSDRQMIEQLEKEMEQQKEKNYQLQQNIAEMIHQLRQERKKSRIQLQSSRKQIESLKQKLNLNQKQIKELQCLISQKQKIIDDTRSQFTREISQLKDKNKTLQQKVAQFTNQLREEKKKYKQLQSSRSQTQRLKLELDSKQKQIKRLQCKINQRQQMIQHERQNSQKYLKQHEQADQLSRKIEYLQIGFPESQIMKKQYDKKVQLVQAISKTVGKEMKDSILLYKFDPKNEVNFHQYIDGKENFLLLIKLQSGPVIGAFSTSKFQQNYKQPENTKAFIFSFENNDKIKTFDFDNKKENTRSLQYDSYNIIIGNSEIRIRAGRIDPPFHLYSNFAVKNSFYDSQGKKVDVLLREGNEREVEIVAFECFQVVFDQ